VIHRGLGGVSQIDWTKRAISFKRLNVNGEDHVRIVKKEWLEKGTL